MSVKRFDIFVDGSFPSDSDLLDCSDGLYAHGEVAQNLYEVLEKFERIKDLWLPPDDVGVEHYGEAEALSSLRSEMLEAMAYARGES